MIVNKWRCPKVWEHTPEPTGYIAWDTWAAGMDALGYTQTIHDPCGLYVLWLTKTGRPARVSIERAIEAGRRRLDAEERA